MMQTRLALAGALALLAATVASADPYLATRTVVVGQDAVPAGVAFCENLSPGLPTNCAAGGLTFAFFDLSAQNGGSAPAALSGACALSKVTTSLGDVSFVCASDVNDDFIVDASDLSFAGSVPSGTQSASQPVCFTPDVAAGGGDWDEVVVFAATGSGVPYAGGLATALLDLQDASSC